MSICNHECFFFKFGPSPRTFLSFQLSVIFLELPLNHLTWKHFSHYTGEKVFFLSRGVGLFFILEPRPRALTLKNFSFQFNEKMLVEKARIEPGTFRVPALYATIELSGTA